MLVKILEGDIVIGAGELTDLDPPMGVAQGNFLAADGYEKTLHANVIDGDYIADRTPGLRLNSAEFGEVECGVISIQDFTETLGECQVIVIGIPYPQYETYFGANPQFAAYFGE